MHKNCSRREHILVSNLNFVTTRTCSFQSKFFINQFISVFVTKDTSQGKRSPKGSAKSKPGSATKGKPGSAKAKPDSAKGKPATPAKGKTGTPAKGIQQV